MVNSLGENWDTGFFTTALLNDFKMLMCTVNLQGITLAKIFKTSSWRAIVS